MTARRTAKTPPQPPTAPEAATLPAVGEWVPPSALVPWAKNPRANDDTVALVAKAIRRFGFGAPIVARRADGMVIAGHTRLRAARDVLGCAVVPVRFLDLSREEAEALALADNKIAETSYWTDALGGVIRELAAAEIPLGDLGWSDADLKYLTEGTPQFLGADRIDDEVARTNNNMGKLGKDGESSGRIFQFGELRCVLPGALYAALATFCGGHPSTQEALCALFSTALGATFAPGPAEKG